MLEVINLTKEFGGVKAVSNVSFKVNKGEIVSIIGPNGAGKTTFFNMLTGLIKPTKGSIMFQGNEIIPEDHPNDIRKLQLSSIFIGIYSFLVMLYFFLIYYGDATFKFEFTIFLISVVLLRIFATIRLYQRISWARGFHSIMMFFDIAFAIYFAVIKGLIILPVIICLISSYFYFYLMSKKVRHLFGEFLEAENISKMGIARTFQNIRLFQNLTVLENILIGSHLHTKAHIGNILLKTKAQQNEEKVLEKEAKKLLEYVGIRHDLNMLASNLPYGEQRKLEIARALAVKPNLLLLDEPAAGMNPKETQELLELIEKIRKTGITVILIEHDMKLVMNISDRIVVLDYGEKIAEGLPEEIRNNNRVIEAYLGA